MLSMQGSVSVKQIGRMRREKRHGHQHPSPIGCVPRPFHFVSPGHRLDVLEIWLFDSERIRQCSEDTYRSELGRFPVSSSFVIEL